MHGNPREKYIKDELKSNMSQIKLPSSCRKTKISGRATLQIKETSLHQNL